MGKRCVVTGCINTCKTNSVFCFPNPFKQNYRETKTFDLAVKRRAAWVAAINRPTFQPSQETSRVCSIHFLNGRPAKLELESHTDWVPTLFMNGRNDDKPVEITSRKRKPAYVYKTEDIDWVPTKNLKTQPDNVPSSLNSSVLSTDVTGSFQSRNEEVSTSTAGCNNTIFEEQINLTDSSRTEFSVFQNGNDSMDESSMTDGPLQSTFIEPKKYPTSDEAGLPEKRQKIASSNSDQEQNNGDQIAIEEPLKQKTVYCRPIQPMNGTWPRVTATIISPESINTAASVINLGLKAKLIRKPGEAADGVSKNSQSITVKKEMEDCSIADEPDCDLHAAYCFTSKLTVERGTQVTADEIRRAFQSTAATQTLWK